MSPRLAEANRPTLYFFTWLQGSKPLQQCDSCAWHPDVVPAQQFDTAPPAYRGIAEGDCGTATGPSSRDRENLREGVADCASLPAGTH